MINPVINDLKASRTLLNQNKYIRKLRYIDSLKSIE